MYPNQHITSTFSLGALEYYHITPEHYYFFETGTNLGACIAMVLPLGFKKIVSIEKEQEFYCQATQRFTSNPNVCIFFGDSACLLEPLLRLIDFPCVFWLDAHEKDSPLRQELTVIQHRNHSGDIILIDDVHLMVEKIDWGKEISTKEITSMFPGCETVRLDSAVHEADILGIRIP